MKGTVIKTIEENECHYARVNIIPDPKNIYKEPIARIQCSRDVQVGDLIAFDAMYFDTVGDKHILLATHPIILKKADGSTPISISCSET